MKAYENLSLKTPLSCSVRKSTTHPSHLYLGLGSKPISLRPSAVQEFKNPPQKKEHD